MAATSISPSSTSLSPSISIEFFPPKDEAGEMRLWENAEHLRVIRPDYVSVTYGAGGSARDRTLRITKELTARIGTSTVAHLTCVGATREQLLETLGEYQAAGIKSILALRGDPTGGPSAEWVPTLGGLDHSDQLVELARDFGGFTIGVAAFPDGHPASHGDFDRDIEVLLRKEQLGASSATTQFFFEASHWLALVELLRKRGSRLPIIAGILPVTNAHQLKRMADLTGAAVPRHIAEAFAAIADDPVAVRAKGVEIATNLCKELLELGVPGLHFYTMNTSGATLEVVNALGLVGNGPS